MAILELKQAVSDFKQEILANQVTHASFNRFNRILNNKPPPKRPEYITHEQFKEKQRQLEYTYRASNSINCLEV